MEIVRSAAEMLVADLNRAVQLSDGWHDVAIGQTLVDAALGRCLEKLASTGIWGRGNQLPSSELWRIAGPILERGSLHCRARFKPRGYAGDFETFVMFWERYVCDDPLGRLFDHYFQRQTAVEAVRGRTEALAAAIVDHAKQYREHPYAITSIGSGPALDIELAMKQLDGWQRDEVSIQLFDLDDDALQYANQRLTRIVPSHCVSIHRENLYRLAERPTATKILGRTDFIFCTGLFDYLPDDSAIKLLRLMWQQLNAGGILMVWNFAPHNPTRTYMEWLGNWYLIYRTREELAALSDAAGIPNEMIALRAERTGVNLLLVATKS
jgi:extracellular factor (EF) 3-hydroxypalmitic acid methyl ester biosynthesis protein